jgi:hypothetical protein
VAKRQKKGKGDVQKKQNSSYNMNNWENTQTNIERRIIIIVIIRLEASDVFPINY